MSTSAVSITELAQAQLFIALLAAEKQLTEFANDGRWRLNADKYVERSRQVAPIATRALLDTTMPSPRLQAGVELLGNLPLIVQALSTLQFEAHNAAARASAQEVPSLRLQALEFEQTEAQCVALLNLLVPLVPDQAVPTDDVENQDTLPLDMAC